jgi:O-methyltransferase involved in polyketide biosynthesis
VLKSVAEFAAGSEIVLTFAPPPGSAPSPFDEVSAHLGEPWVTYFEPEALERKLRRAGFSSVEFLSPRDAEERYFRDRPQDLPILKRTNLVCAII